MLRRTFAILATGAALFGATVAHAGTSWSIGIHLPGAGVVLSDSPRYHVRHPAPVYYTPAPVVRYVPAPRYVEREVYYAPAPRVVYETHYRHRHHGHAHRWDDRRNNRNDRYDRYDRRDDWRDDHGPHRGR